MLFPILIATLAFGCNNSNQAEDMMASKIDVSYMLPSPPVIEEVAEEAYMDDEADGNYRDATVSSQTVSKKESREEKKIKRGYIQAHIDDIHSGKEFVNQIVERHNSYYENESYSDSDYESVYSLSIRIPADAFVRFLTSLESSNAKIISKQISTENVTGEYYDIKVALENKKRYLDQYRELLKKTGSVKDLLEVQERIRRLSEEMDISKGRLTYLDDNVGFSTLNLTLSQRHERIISQTPNNIGQRLINAFNHGAQSMVSLFVFLISIWPMIILFGCFLIFRKHINMPAFFRTNKK